MNQTFQLLCLTWKQQNYIHKISYAFFYNRMMNKTTVQVTSDTHILFMKKKKYFSRRKTKSNATHTHTHIYKYNQKKLSC